MFLWVFLFAIFELKNTFVKAHTPTGRRWNNFVPDHSLITFPLFFKKYCFSSTLWLRYVANHFMNCIFPFYDILSLVLCVFVVSCACAWMYVTSFVDDVLQKHLIHVSLQKKTRVVCALCLLKVYLASLRFSGFATCCGVTLNSALSENSHFFSKPSIAPPTLATVW